MSESTGARIIQAAVTFANIITRQTRPHFFLAQTKEQTLTAGEQEKNMYLAPAMNPVGMNFLEL